MKVSELYRKLLRVHVDGPDEEIGGGLPVWFQSGDGPPGPDDLNIAPSQVAALYQDLVNGALYVAFGTTSADWFFIGGVDNSNSDTELPGVKVYGHGHSRLSLVAPSGQGMSLHGNVGPNVQAPVMDLRSNNFVRFTTSPDDSVIHQFLFTPDGAVGVQQQGTSQKVAFFYGLPTVPNDATGVEDAFSYSWGFTDDGHIYFKTGGTWVQKV